VARITGIQVGVERMIGNTLWGFINMTLRAGNASLGMGRQREIHVRFFMAVNAECRNWIDVTDFTTGSGDLL
jgi:hypothetical protein